MSRKQPTPPPKDAKRPNTPPPDPPPKKDDTKVEVDKLELLQLRVDTVQATIMALETQLSMQKTLLADLTNQIQQEQLNRSE